MLKFEKVGIYFEVFWSGWYPKIHTSTGSRGQWDVIHSNVPKHSVSTDTRKDDLYQKKISSVITFTKCLSLSLNL